MKLLNEDESVSFEMKSILENTSDIMFLKNKDFVYIACSKSFAQDCTRSYDIDNVIGKTDYDLFKDRSVADHYRENDIELFKSGKPMVEFRENYLDANGKKHFCLTTKYLIHDKNGNPAAIFGQYHDIDQQAELEIQRRKDINKNIVASLGGSFFAANYVSLLTHKYDILKSTEYSSKMLENCDTIEKAFAAFIQTLVKTEFQDKMRLFCDADTIAERVKNNPHIDCEYLSKIASGWCRASFYPTEWDKNGNVTHVLFVVCSVDKEKSKELEEGISNKKELETIFNEVPGGIVLYKWDGKKLKVLKMSKYYQDVYGFSMLENDGSPDFMRVHPDDLEAYQKAILRALNVTHTLDYVYRAWNPKTDSYVWTQINAISHPQSDGTSLVYALYSDITKQKSSELLIAKKQASLVSALKASNQLCYEYDPVEHTADCLTDDNFLNLPTHIANYPESLLGLFPDDQEEIKKFIAAATQIENGKKKSHCDIHIKTNGGYKWFSCTFNTYFDTVKERDVAIITVLDISFRVEVIQNYKSRLRSLENTNRNSLCMCDVNITKNQFSNIHAEGIINEYGKRANTLDEFLSLTSERVYSDNEKEKYLSIFNQKNLLKLFENGSRHIKFEHFYRVTPTHTVWIETVFDLVPEPITGDIVGICYAKSLNEEKMSRILLDAALDKDYPLAALLYIDTGECFLFETRRNEYCVCKQDYWNTVFTRLKDSASNKDLAEVRKNISKEVVVANLEKSEYYTYTFYGTYLSSPCRLEARFRYVDKKHNLVIATLRNITDTSLYEKYKYDSEHDALTNLLNRQTVFNQCRNLLNSHPDQKFIMLHCDINHFHLYNTFFGEKAGDILLCRIADTMKYLSKEYEYITFGRIESDVFCMFFPANEDIFKRQIISCFKEVDEFSPNFPLRLAIGAYLVNDPTMSIESMFTRATIAAKSDKKNLFGLISQYDESMEQDLIDNHQIISEMNRAISEEQFKVYLQPKYSLRSGYVVGAEALVRWNHPEKGMISPDKFIPVFEKNGFIVELDKYMWEHVCQILHRWKLEGKPMLPISANVSRVSMYSHATVPFIKSLIKKYDLDPKYFELELTETAYMDDPEDLKCMLKELQDSGFKILMDDFGSGYSSLNTLRELPVDILKLDIKFLSLSQNDLRGNAVLSSVVRMSKLLNLPIVAEGVEKQEQADYLRSIGCEYVQGFLFARPMPLVDYEKILGNYEVQKQNNIPKENNVHYAHKDFQLNNPFESVGLLEFSNEKFAYLHTNKCFIKEFGLVENLKPASKVFREHLDEKNYATLINAFSYCSKEKKETMFTIEWLENDNKKRLYQGHVFYNGTTGVYSDLLVIFTNITNVHMIGVD